jgi:hypothetical protein
VKTRFQSLLAFKCNLCRYAGGITAQAMPETLALQRAGDPAAGEAAGLSDWLTSPFSGVLLAGASASQWVGSTASWLTQPPPRVEPAPTDDSWSAPSYGGNFNNNNAGYERTTTPYSIYKSPAPSKPASRPRPSDREKEKEKERDSSRGGGGRGGGGSRGGGGRDRDDKDSPRDRRGNNNAPTFSRQRVAIPQTVRERTMSRVQNMLKKEMDGGGDGGGGGRGGRDTNSRTRDRGDRDRDRGDRDRDSRRGNARRQRQR